MIKSVLITGANGFLGRALVRKFIGQGWAVVALVRDADAYSPFGSETVRELSDQWENITDILDDVKVTTVIHTATSSLNSASPSDSEQMIKTNILYPTKMLSAMMKNNIKTFLNCSTNWQSMSGKNYNPFNFYAATKESFENIVEYFVSEGIRAASIRLFDTYGPGDTRRKFLNLVIDAARRGDALGASPGEQRIHLVHIDDVANAFLIAAEDLLQSHLPVHYKWQAPSEELLTLREIVARLEKSTGRTVNVKWGERPYRPGEIMNPHSHLPLVPRWRPEVLLDEGLRVLLSE
jgi:nucleoside-diphosphate-sugar epimerase